MGDNADTAALEAERASARDAGENVREAKVTVAPPSRRRAPHPAPRLAPCSGGGALTHLPHGVGGEGSWLDAGGGCPGPRGVRDGLARPPCAAG